MSGISQVLAEGGIFAIAILLKAAFILGAAWILARCARRSSAALRHSIWTVALAGAVLLPVLSEGLPSLNISLDIRLPVSALSGVPSEMPLAEANPPAAAATASLAELRGAPQLQQPTRVGYEVVPPQVESERAVVGWLKFLVALWIVGALGRLLWFANQFRRIRWLSGHTPPEVDSPVVHLTEQLAQQLGIRRQVCVLESSWASIPLTWGVLRPVILLPEEARDWPTERLRVVLLHELGHVRRWDYLVYLVAEVACALYWPLPLVWLARSHVQKEQEQACDDLVLASGVTPVDYAEHLLAVARSFYGNRGELAATVAMAREISLKHRIRVILDSSTNRRPALSGYGLPLILLLFGFALPVAALRPVEAESDRAQDHLPAGTVEATGPAASVATAAVAEVRDDRALVASTRVWIEAEDGQATGSMQIREDLAASSGSYALVPVGTGNDTPEGGSGQLTFTFEVPATGEYLIWGRAMGPRDDANSFYISIDEGDDHRWDVETREGELLDAWGWVPLRNSARSSSETLMRVQLAAGIHTLRVRSREAGTLLDRLLVTGDPAYVPSGRGEAGAAYRPTYRWMEVEQAALTGSIETEQDEHASGGRFIVFEQGRGSEPSGSATFAFEVDVPGRYVVWGRVLAPDGAANSFYVSLDGGEEVIWDAPRRLGSLAGRWGWIPLNARDYNGRRVDPLLLDLQPGHHVLRLRTREPGVALDGILVTNDVGVTPRGVWPTTLPVRPVAVWAEAESALLDAPFLIRSDTEASGGFYVQVENGDARFAQPREGSRGSALLTFTVPEAGIYNLWARTRAHHGSENSFWVRVNGHAWIRWNDFPVDGAWGWSMVHDEDRHSEVAQFHLRPGDNTLEFAAREGGARIDRVMITNDPLANPDADDRR